MHILLGIIANTSPVMHALSVNPSSIAKKQAYEGKNISNEMQNGYKNLHTHITETLQIIQNVSDAAVRSWLTVLFTIGMDKRQQSLS